MSIHLDQNWMLYIQFRNFFLLHFKSNKWLDVPNPSCLFGSIRFVLFRFVRAITYAVHLCNVTYTSSIYVLRFSSCSTHLDAIDFICYGLFLIQWIRNGYIVVGVIVSWTTVKRRRRKWNERRDVFFKKFCIRISYLANSFSPLSLGSESMKHNAINELHRGRKKRQQNEEKKRRR